VKRVILVIPPLRNVVFTEDLQNPSSGGKVTKLQKTLTRELFYDGPVDGSFSEAVTAAVKRYQANYELEQTGVVDAPTRYLLNSCWTDWQMRPECGTPQFLTFTDGEAIYQSDFREKGTPKPKPKKFDPFTRDVNWTNYVIGTRFKNPSSKTVGITIWLH